MYPSRVHRRENGVRAQTRRANGLAVVVDAEAECDGVAAVRMEFMDLAIWFPDHGFKTENLVGRAGCAGWIRNAILRKPDDLALIVEIKSAGVFAALRVLAALQVGKRLQGPIFPDGPEALTVSLVPAKVFAGRTEISGGLGTNRRLATQVRPVGPAVAGGTGWSVECAEVVQAAAAIPKEGVLGAAGNEVRRPSHPARIVNVSSCAIRPGSAQGAEIGNGVVDRFVRLLGQPGWHRQKSQQA